MAFDIGIVFNNTLSGLIVNAPWFILIYISIKILSKEIKGLAKHIPEWIESYGRIREHNRKIDWARNIK